MKKEVIELLIKQGVLRIRQKDTERIKSLIISAEIDATAAKKIQLTEETANLIFRGIYEPIRQLGDAWWWLTGYEPADHQTSLESLKDLNINEKIRLNFLDRFRKIRNDSNYRGMRVSVAQVKEILDFWNACGKEIIKQLLEQTK
ncbi:MAG: hypothetical protein HY363_01065 [Candidatus Aenigmarchaeota archaeon]|nr:hypothetical protein [Candidatus Aenigmarchaeota archaeon]